MTAVRTAVVRTELVDGILRIGLDSPPVNMGNARLRAGLLDAFREADDSGVRGVVVHSMLPNFYAGSDLREFDGEITYPELPDVLSAMDALAVPIVVALQGNVLGGGLELALAADVRVAAADTILGFPETSLGMIPGAGGTVRASRLIGVPATVDLVASARRIRADEAFTLGLVDEVADTTDVILDLAVARASSAAKRRLRDSPVPHFTSAEFDAAASAVTTRRTRPNVHAAIELIKAGAALPGAEALEAERALFTSLRAGEESRALRYLFFARSAAAKSVRSHGPARAVAVIGVAGAGTMGSAVALTAARAGWQVRVFDMKEDVLARAQSRFAEAEADGHFGTDIGILADADLVIDAVFEDMDVKKQLLRALSKVVRADAVIASNTSYLDLDELAETVDDPWRFAGFHFFNPADRNPLLEIVRCKTTTESTLSTLGAVARRLGKTSIPARVGDGFVANRVYAAYRAQAELLIEDGASPRQVDRAMEAFGLSIGPFAVGDMSGLDIAWARRQRLAAARDPEQRYVAIPDRICELGRLGRKTGAGYYDYTAEAPRGAESDVVAGLIAQEREWKGIVPRDIDQTEIVQRCVCAMVLAAAELVDEQIAERASDIDLALVDGFAFPAWRGGPVHFAAQQPADWVAEGMRAVFASDPIGFASAAEAEGGAIPEVVARVLEA